MLVRMGSRASARLAALFLMTLLAVAAFWPALAAHADETPVKIESIVHGRVFRWRVTNQTAAPILRFEVPTYAVYSQVVPKGWRLHPDEGKLLASVEHEHAALRRGRTLEFSCVATSSSAIVGEARALVGLEGGGTLSVEGVWVPEPERRSTVWIPPAVIVALLAVHLAFRRIFHTSPAP
jgi:hypothetical protein